MAALARDEGRTPVPPLWMDVPPAPRLPHDEAAELDAFMATLYVEQARRNLARENHPEPIGEELPFLTALEITSAIPEQPEWVLGPGLVALGAITEIDGKIKAAGKTTLALWMVRAILDGAPFLGEPSRTAKVLYYTEQTRQTFGYALRAAGLADRGDELLVLCREDVRTEAWPVIVAGLRRDGYAVVVIDTIGKLAGLKDENAASEWAVAMSPLQDVAASGRAVIVARHDRKSGGDVGDSGRGSSQASGDVDVILALRRPEGNQPSNRRVIETLSRYSETPERFVVELTPEGYTYLGSDEAVTARLAESVVVSSLGAEFGTRGSEWVAGPRIVELAMEQGVSRTAAAKALADLTRSGQLERKGREKKKNEPYEYRTTDQVVAESVSGTQILRDTDDDTSYDQARAYLIGLDLPEASA